MTPWGHIRIKPQRRTTFIASADNKANKIRIEHHNSVTMSCEFDYTGKYLLSANDRSQINICNIVEAFDKLVYLKYHWKPVTEVHYSRDATRFYSSSIDGSIVVWTVEGCFPAVDLLGHTGGVNSVNYSRVDEALLCSGAMDGTIRIWDVRSGQCASTYNWNQVLSQTCFSACGNYVFGSGLNGAITTLDLRMKESVHTLTEHTAPVTGLSLAPCGTYLASCSADNTLRVWDVSSLAEEPKEIRRFFVEQDAPFNMIRCNWSWDSSMLTVGTSDRDVLVFGMEDGKLLNRLDGHGYVVTQVAFHPTKPVLMSAGTDGCVILHDL